MKTLSKIVLPTDLSNWYIKKYSNLLEILRVMVFLYATTVLLTAFYVKNKQKTLMKRDLYGVTKAVVQRCSLKKVCKEIFQNSQKDTSAEVFFLKKLQV